MAKGRRSRPKKKSFLSKIPLWAKMFIVLFLFLFGFNLYSPLDIFHPRVLGDSSMLLTGTVYNDKNKDGKRHIDEKGIKGVKVVIPYSIKNGRRRTVNLTRTSDANGRYTFNVEPGLQYIIRVVPPCGYKLSTPSPESGFILHDNVLRAHFGMYQVEKC